MNKPVLVIMAAGMGSRYGGLKQLDPVDNDGHIIMDFSMYDAKRAGFEKVVFIIKHEIEEEFKEHVGKRMEKYMDVAYAYQNIDNIPEGYEVPEGRVKPWGTAHAVYSCMDEIDGPFAVINADDYYGVEAFKLIYDYLSTHADDDKYRYTMVGYHLANTVTDNGYVSRGVCETNENGELISVTERTRIEKYNGGVAKPDLTKENVEALEKGIVNLGVHIDNLKKFGVPVVVAINHFYTDTEAEIAVVKKYCEDHGAKVAFSDVFLKGGDGGIELANAVVETIESTRSEYKPLYDEKLSIKEKLDVIAKEIYRADGVNYTAKADKAIKEIESLGLDRVPVCVAKTQYSLSDDPTKLGRPEHFTINVSDVRASAGAGFVVVYTGDVMTMPGLPKVPAADNIDVDADGRITGLF